MEGKAAVAGAVAADDGDLGQDRGEGGGGLLDGTRSCWYIAADGSGGMSVVKVADSDAAVALMLEVSLALGEFLELESRIVLDLDSAMPAITNAMAYAQ